MLGTDLNCSEQIASEATQTLVVCVASSFNWIGLVGPAVILLSVAVAAYGVAMARASTRQRATLDMIEKVESTPYYQEQNSVFSYHRRQNGFAKLHSPAETKDREERRAILGYLNHYELVSIGIRRKILDEAFYREWMRGPFVRDWNAAADFIQRERWKWDAQSEKWDYHHVLFENFQKMACRWSEEAIVLTKSFSKPPEAPSGPGDEALPDGKKSD